MNKEELENQYRQIVGLYDLAEDLASTVDSEFVKDKDAQIMLIEPLIAHVAEAADVLTEEFVGVFEVPSRKKNAKGRVEGALRRLFTAFEEYRTQVGLRSKQLVSGIANIADPIVEKLRKQVEKITLMFIQLIELSLDRVMHKYEVEEFRRSNEKALLALAPQVSF